MEQNRETSDRSTSISLRDKILNVRPRYRADGDKSSFPASQRDTRAPPGTSARDGVWSSQGGFIMSTSAHSLFSAAAINGLSLRNRFAVAPMTRVSATEDGTATERMASYYE